MFRKTIITGVALGMAIGASSLPVQPAYSQDGLEEIIVTARKKEESLIDAPIAVSVFGSAELSNAGYNNILDVAKAAPGLFIEKNNQAFARVNTTPRFRGIFFSSGDRLLQTATVFLDGIYMSGGIQTLSVGELERIEIIKGPQSSLFGRNTFAGAINYVSKDPSDEFGIELDATGASRDEYRLGVAVEGPIFEGVSGRLGANFESNRGHYENSAVAKQQLGDEEQYSINGTLLIEPNDKLRIKLRGSYREVDDGPPAANATAGILAHNFGGFLIQNGLGDLSDSVVPAPLDGSALLDGTRGESVFAGTIGAPQLAGLGLTSGFNTIQAFRTGYLADGRISPDTARLEYNVLNTDEFGLQLDSIRFSLNAQYDITDAISLSFLAGYNDEAYGYWSDFDLRADNSFTSFVSAETEDTSLEARLSGSAMDDKLFWSFGASYVDIEVQSVSGTASFFLFPIFFGDIFRTEPFVDGAKTTGIFASLDYSFTDKFSVTVEGRYQEDEIFDEDVNATLAQPISPATIDNFVPRVTFKYEPSENTTLYFTYSEGNLPGGFNPEIAELDAQQLSELAALAPGASTTYEEESLANHEFGWKQSLLDGRASINMAAFYMERTDEIFRSIELVTDTTPNAPNPFRTVAFTSNGASTDIYGVELEGAWLVNDNISLQGSFAYINAEIASFPEGAGTGDFGDIFGPAANVEGQEAPRFPPLAGSLSGTYEAPFNRWDSFDSWYVRGDVFYTGKYYDSVSNVTEVEAATDVNVRFGFRGEKLGVELFVTNLLGEDAPAAASNFADISLDVRTMPGGFLISRGKGAQVALRDRRQIGLRLKYSF